MAEPTKTGSKTKKTLTAAYKGYKDGSVDFLGDQIEAVSGYSRDEFNIQKRKWQDLALEEDRHSMKAAFVQALKSDKTYTREYRIRSKNGKILWIQEWSQIICDDGGEIEYVTGILMNITEQKQTELDRLKAEERTGKYLTFALAGQEYGLSIMKVKEIIEILPITIVPQAPSFVRGVINLRGKVIPVVDMRRKFGLDGSDNSNRSCIVVVEVATGLGSRIPIGITVDAVSDVVHIKGMDVEDAPSIITDLDTDFILGMAKIGKAVTIILDIDRVLGGVDLTCL
jgi:purine-binding chemotaxis protein CheW